jgi:hypothetical protein
MTIRARYPFNPRDVSIDQLSDPTRATPDQVAAIRTLYPRLNECRKIALNGLSIVEPGLVPIFARTYAAADDDVIRLIQGQLTWGEAKQTPA